MLFMLLTNQFVTMLFDCKLWKDHTATSVGILDSIVVYIYGSVCSLFILKNSLHIHRCSLVPHPYFAHLLYVHQYNVLHNSNKKQFCCIYVAHWYVLAIGCNHVHIFPHLAFTGTISLMPALSPLPKLSTQQSLSQNYRKPCFDP